MDGGAWWVTAHGVRVWQDSATKAHRLLTSRACLILLLYMAAPAAYWITCLLQGTVATKCEKDHGKETAHNPQQCPTVLPPSPNSYPHGLLPRGLEEKKHALSLFQLPIITSTAWGAECWDDDKDLPGVWDIRHPPPSVTGSPRKGEEQPEMRVHAHPVSLTFGCSDGTGSHGVWGTRQRVKRTMRSQPSPLFFKKTLSCGVGEEWKSGTAVLTIRDESQPRPHPILPSYGWVFGSCQGAVPVTGLRGICRNDGLGL